MRKSLAFVVIAIIAGAVAGVALWKSSKTSAVNNHETKNDGFGYKAKQEYSKLIKHYSALTSINANYSILLKTLKGNIVESGTGVLVQDSTGFYIKVLDFEQLLGQGYTVAIGHEDKTFSAVAVNEHDKAFMLDRNQESFIWTDSFHLFPDSVLELSSETKNRNVLTIHVQKGDYYLAELEYNPTTLEMYEVRMYTLKYPEQYGSDEGDEDLTGEESPDEPEPVILVYHYDKLEINKPVDRKLFNPFRFIRLNGDNPLPKAKYEDYELQSNN